MSISCFGFDQSTICVHKLKNYSFSIFRVTDSFFQKNKNIFSLIEWTSHKTEEQKRSKNERLNFMRLCEYDLFSKRFEHWTTERL